MATRRPDSACFVSLGCAVGLLLSFKAAAMDWSQPWSEPQDTSVSEASGDEYAWRLFVALNWPADPATRAADPSKRLGAEGPVVWEVWQSAAATYLAYGADPGPWGNASVPPAGNTRFDPVAVPAAGLRQISKGVMVPMFDLLLAASHLNETRMNRETYEYIRGHQLYNLDGQLKLYAQNQGIAFPTAAKEIKAQWRPISHSQRSRYYSLEIVGKDGSRRLYGLTALHIASKDRPDWFWATFEQVDNPTRPDSEAWQLKSRDRFACAGQAADCNRIPAGIGLEGTVWENYRLRGSMTGFTEASGTAALLANSQFEQGMQGSSSCMTCHARATIGVMAGKPQRLSVFDIHGNGIDADASAPIGAALPGYVGAPDPAWYLSETQGREQKQIFMPLDFVWSLAKAQASEAQ